MIKKVYVKPTAENENAEWQKFKSQSDEQIASNEKRVGEFRQQSNNIGKSQKKSFGKKVSDLEEKNTALKKKMKDYTEDRTEKQETFINEFNTGMKELT